MKHKKGFTLIEVVVVIVLSSVLLAGLVPLLPVAQKQMYRTQNTTSASQVGESIYKYIVDTLDTADQIWIGDNKNNQPDPSTNSAGWSKLTVENGVLLLNGAAVYDANYQNGCMLTLSANGIGRTNIELGLELTKVTGEQSEVLYTQSSAFSPARMNTSSFSCIQGSIGTEIATMSYSSGQISTLGSVPQLVIYFQSAANETIPVFTPVQTPTTQPTAATPSPIPTVEPTATPTPATPTPATPTPATPNPDTPTTSDSILKIQLNEWSYNINSFNYSNQIILVPVGTNGIVLGSYFPNFDNNGTTFSDPIDGIWKITKNICYDGSDTAVVSTSPSDPTQPHINRTISVSALREGVAELTFTATGKKYQWDTPYNPALDGQTTKITIISYDASDYAKNSRLIHLNYYFDHLKSTNNGSALEIPFKRSDTSFTNVVFSVEIVANIPEIFNTIKQKLDESPTVTLSTQGYVGGGPANPPIPDTWKPEEDSKPYYTKNPSSALLLPYSETEYRATVPLYFDDITPHKPSQQYKIYCWVYSQLGNINDIWFQKKPYADRSYSCIFDNKPCIVNVTAELSQIYKHNQDSVVVQDNGKWVGRYSPVLSGNTIFIPVGQSYPIASYAPDYIGDYLLFGKWTSTLSVTPSGEPSDTILASSVQENLNKDISYPLILLAENEGIVTLKHTATGNYYTNSGTYVGYHHPLQNAFSQVTIIFYDAEKVANGTSELLKSSLTLTTGTDETKSDSITTAYTAEGEVFAKATFSLDVVPKWNWDESKVNVEEIIRNALESNPPSVSLSTFKTSMTSWSDVSAIAKPENTTLIASSEHGTYQATFPLAFSNSIPTSNAETDLYAWISMQNSTIQGGIAAVFDPTLPNRCTVTITPPDITLYIGITNSGKKIGSELSINKGQELSFCAYDPTGIYRLTGTWTIGKNSYTNQEYCPATAVKGLSAGIYQVTFNSNIAPYNPITKTFTLVVKESDYLVAFSDEYDKDDPPTPEYNSGNHSFTAYFGDTIDLYAYLRKNGGTPSNVDGTWSISYPVGQKETVLKEISTSTSHLELEAIRPENASQDQYTVYLTFTRADTASLPLEEKQLKLTMYIRDSKLRSWTTLYSNKDVQQGPNDPLNIIGTSKLFGDPERKNWYFNIKTPVDMLENKEFRWLINGSSIYSISPETQSGDYYKYKLLWINYYAFHYDIKDFGRSIQIKKSTSSGSLSKFSRNYTLTLQYRDPGESLWTTYDSINFKA